MRNLKFFTADPPLGGGRIPGGVAPYVNPTPARSSIPTNSKPSAISATSYDQWRALGNTGNEADFLNAKYPDPETKYFLAATNLSAGRVVMVNSGGGVRCLNTSQAGDVGRAVGITITSATAGQPVLIQQRGTVQDASFNFEIGAPVFIGVEGRLTTTVPPLRIVQAIGTAAAINKVLVNFTLSLIRNT